VVDLLHGRLGFMDTTQQLLVRRSASSPKRSRRVRRCTPMRRNISRLWIMASASRCRPWSGSAHPHLKKMILIEFSITGCSLVKESCNPRMLRVRETRPAGCLPLKPRVSASTTTSARHAHVRRTHF
jgi:hypothetical protein